MNVCHQRRMREIEAARDPRPQDTAIDYTVQPIDADEAEAFIARYEWLGTVGYPVARYGARNPAGKLAAVALFGNTGATQAGEICGSGYADLAICLERGACSHWAHPCTASWFIPRACAMAARDHGWRIFYAYADPEAGEIGTVYQAATWLYLGQTPGRLVGGEARPRDHFRHRDDKELISERKFRRQGYKIADVNSGEWEREFKPAKLKYVWLEGTQSERQLQRRALMQQPLPYPKRGGPAGRALPADDRRSTPTS
jgi:hypothetical protein